MLSVRVIRSLVITLGVVFLASLVLTGHSGAAEKYPKKNINWIVMWNPGGGADTATRFFTKQAEKILGKRIIVQNMPGGAGTLGYTAAKNAKPDGYTLLTVQGHLPGYKLLELAPIDIGDFDILGGIAFQSPVIVARAEAPWNTASEFAEDARKKPGKYSIGVSDIGGCFHVPMVLWMDLAGFDAKAVVFGGSPQQTAGLLGGHVDLLVTWVRPNIGYVKERKLKFLGYMSSHRQPDYPDMPTLRELGWDVVWEHPYGVGGPKGLPKRAKKVLSKTTKKVWEIPEFEQDLKKLGLTVLREDGPAYEKHLYKMRDDMGKAMNLIKAKGK